MLVPHPGHRFDADPERDQRPDQEGGGVGEERTLEAPLRVDRGGGEWAHHDGDVLRTAEEGVGRHQLRAGHQPRRDGVERRGGERLDQTERQRQQDDRRVAVGTRERERVDHAEQVGDEERAPGTQAVDGHTEQRAEQRARDRQHDEEQREVARADVETERREAPDGDDRDPVARLADRLPEEEQREAPHP